MNRGCKTFGFVAFLALLTAGPAFTQTPSTEETRETAGAESSSSSVAYVYVSRPTHIDGFVVATDGKLTPVPGSPFPDISVSHMSVNKKYLFGLGDDHQHIYTFSIASNGALKQVAANVPDSFVSGPINIDFTGSTLYDANMDSDSFIQSYKIEENGTLQFLGETPSDSTFDIQEVAPTMISFIGTNQYAYQTGCDEDALNPATEKFKREPSGEVKFVSGAFALPKPPDSGDVYCPYQLATDPTDHLAVAVQDWNENEGEPVGLIALAAFTADSDGNLTTHSTYENMPSIDTGYVNTMSISPTGKLLVVGGAGFQVFHFNGSNPVTSFTRLLQANDQFLEFGWDSHNRLYALSVGTLRVYTVTPTSITEASGSPYSIPEASSVVVLSPQ
jgi:hypothetical protein